jgi:hypothetical protein
MGRLLSNNFFKIPTLFLIVLLLPFYQDKKGAVLRDFRPKFHLQHLPRLPQNPPITLYNPLPSRYDNTKD